MQGLTGGLKGVGHFRALAPGQAGPRTRANARINAGPDDARRSRRWSAASSPATNFA